MAYDWPKHVAVGTHEEHMLCLTDCKLNSILVSETSRGRITLRFNC